MKIEIQPFQPSDAKDLSRMIYKTISQMEEDNPQISYQLVKSEDTPEELLKASKNGVIWLAKENEKIAGTISLHDNRIRRFFVHPEFQRKGVGRNLINNVINFAKNNNIKELWVGALLRAVPFYKKLGFKEGNIFLNPEINQQEMEMRLLIK